MRSILTNSNIIAVGKV